MAAFPRVYSIFVGVGVFATNGGVDWDPGGGAPDPYVIIDGGAPSIVVQDQSSAEFGPTDLTRTQPGFIVLTVYDEDGAVDDPVIGCQVPATAANLRLRDFFPCMSNRGIVYGSIVPQ